MSAGYEDMTSYHGGRYPAGTALAYKALLLAKDLLFPDGAFFVRGKCSIETAFAGLGFLDAIEMVLRCSSLGLYRVDTEMPAPDGTPLAPVRGKFFYRFIQEDGVLELTVKPNLVPQEFYRATEDLHSGKIKSEDGPMALRRTVESALLSLDPTDIFDVRALKPCTVKTAEPVAAPSLDDPSRLVLEDFDSYKIGIRQLQRYHGDQAVCGLCLTWALARQWAKTVFKGDPVPRRKVSVKVGASGKGIDDAIEFLFRLSGTERSTIDLRWGKEMNAPEVLPGAGFFAFQISMADTKRAFVLKEDLVPREYLRLCAIKAANPSSFKEETERKKLQYEFASRMLLESEPFQVQD